MEFDSGSFRDRAARVFRSPEGRIYRCLSASAWQNWRMVSDSAFFKDGMRDGRIVATRAADPSLLSDSTSAAQWVGVLEHEMIPFISYPFEWSFSMLRDAAVLHLELLIEAVAQGFTIKDGTAYNVQFRNLRPIFIDITSFEPLTPGLPWMGYRQFCQLFLFPLMLQAFRNLPSHPWLRGRLEGITPQECWQLMSFRDRCRMGVLTHVGMHAWVESHATGSSQGTSQSLSQAGFDSRMVIQSARNLQRTVERLRWSPPKTTWSNYGCGAHYTAETQQQKERFVRRALQSRHWQQVWDLGGNIGHYGEIAAEHAEQVVVVDADHAAIEQCYQRLSRSPSATSQRVLPLVASVVDLPGDLGWNGRERRAFVNRGKPDLILCLALVHHVVIGSGVPLPEFMAWLASFGASIVIEFVHRDDPKVQQMLRDRRDACEDYAEPHFEQALNAHFQVTYRENLANGTRTLVFAEPKP